MQHIQNRRLSDYCEDLPVFNKCKHFERKVIEEKENIVHVLLNMDVRLRYLHLYKSLSKYLTLYLHADQLFFCFTV